MRRLRHGVVDQLHRAIAPVALAVEPDAIEFGSLVLKPLPYEAVGPHELFGAPADVLGVLFGGAVAVSDGGDVVSAGVGDRQVPGNLEAVGLGVADGRHRITLRCLDIVVSVLGEFGAVAQHIALPAATLPQR